MDFNANGTYSSGLKIYKSTDLELHSTLKKSWFSGCIISIFNRENELLLEIKVSGIFGSKYKINFQNDSILKRKFKINEVLPTKTELTFENNDKIRFTHRWFPITNPYSKITFNEKDVGKVKIKPISLERNYKIELTKTEIELYILILFLCTESDANFD